MTGFAWILTKDEQENMRSRTPAAAHALCGKPVAAHVKDTIAEIEGITFAQAEATGADYVLFAAANAPLVTANSYRMLAAALENADCTAAALVTNGETVACCVRAEYAMFALSDALSMEEAVARIRENAAIFEVEADAAEGIRVRTRADLAKAGAAMRARINEKLMEDGVTLIDPQQTYVDWDVTVGCDTVIYPGCILENGTQIGEGCTLYANCRLNGAKIGSDVTIESSVILDASVADHTTVGPYAYIRPHTQVGENCRIGDFVELKNSNIGNGTKVSHLTYVGDSDLGEKINLGCGVVFVNYDGKRKQRSTVGDHAFIGCNVNLVAPVNVGNDAYIAAGSTVTCDVPDGAMLIARQREAIKEGWVAARKESGKL